MRQVQVGLVERVALGRAINVIDKDHRWADGARDLLQLRARRLICVTPNLTSPVFLFSSFHPSIGSVYFGFFTRRRPAAAAANHATASRWAARPRPPRPLQQRPSFQRRKQASRRRLQEEAARAWRSVVRYTPIYRARELCIAVYCIALSPLVYTKFGHLVYIRISV